MCNTNLVKRSVCMVELPSKVHIESALLTAIGQNRALLDELDLNWYKKLLLYTVEKKVMIERKCEQEIVIHVVKTNLTTATYTFEPATDNLLLTYLWSRDGIQEWQTSVLRHHRKPI